MTESNTSPPLGIRFQQVPVVQGRLAQLNHLRPDLLNRMTQNGMGQLLESGSPLPLETLLAESLYDELSLGKADGCLWRRVQAGLLGAPGAVDRPALLREVLAHYAEEIGGHFDPRIYRLATRMVPWGFSFLLNALSPRRFLPWGMGESLRSRLRIEGEITHLQKLATKGTILLVPTHQSNLDSMLLGYVIYLMSLPPFAFGAGLNLYSNPILGFFMSHLGAYTVDRKKTNVVYKTALRNYSVEILREGIHSIFFPGGGRSRSGAIETKLKLGLLGTGIAAQIAQAQTGAPSMVFVVPLVSSYHFVLEAKSLIQGHLMSLGGPKFLRPPDESSQWRMIFQFFWRLFYTQSEITVRIGRPLDVLGNDVDEEGRSIGPQGRLIDPLRAFHTNGQLMPEAQRDQEYTRELGRRVTERFHQDNTVLDSHLLAFSFFEALRAQYPDFELYRFLRLERAQRALPLPVFLEFAARTHAQLVELARRGALRLSFELQSHQVESWVESGARNLGVFHDRAVVRLRDGVISTEDLNLLYYYRNRLTGYGLGRQDSGRIYGGEGGGDKHDAQGFLV